MKNLETACVRGTFSWRGPQQAEQVPEDLISFVYDLFAL